MEMKDAAYHGRVRSGYLKLAKNDPGRVKTIKVNKGIKEVHDLVLREVELVIQRYKRA